MNVRRCKKRRVQEDCGMAARLRRRKFADATDETDEVCLYDIEFSGAAAIGIQFETDFYGNHAIVKAVESEGAARNVVRYNERGKPTCIVQKGHIVVAVDGKDVSNLPFQEVMLAIKATTGATSRVLRFLDPNVLPLDQMNHRAADALLNCDNYGFAKDDQYFLQYRKHLRLKKAQPNVSVPIPVVLISFVQHYAETKGKQELTNVLVAYSMHNTAVGRSMLGAQVDQVVFKRLVALQLPAIAEAFDNAGIAIELVTLQWFLCVFVCTLPLDTALRVWDYMFLQGEQGAAAGALNMFGSVKYYFTVNNTYVVHRLKVELYFLFGVCLSWHVITDVSTSCCLLQLLEICLMKLGLYLLNSQINWLDLVSFTGYKYVALVLNTVVHLVLGYLPYYAVLAYTGLATSFFTVTTTTNVVLRSRL
ncbi:hypothetical protein DYB32_000722 [Aphanomyces invadans]|uniref:Rab-GAP TBC domain-containing protein n=1 Tax=Aphanomyces invadans TaxID=157072 RepID=A0A3R6YG55_9STRA|nr:hypothetical protein DYB32_000722 [Aphanomyces invadans]